MMAATMNSTGGSVENMPTARPAMSTVAGPVSDAFAMLCEDVSRNLQESCHSKSFPAGSFGWDHTLSRFVPKLCAKHSLDLMLWLAMISQLRTSSLKGTLRALAGLLGPDSTRWMCSTRWPRRWPCPMPGQ